MSERRSQQERRDQTTQAVLQSACRLFGERGYNQTSLEDIASDCGLTTRPVYHYFGNKQGLFLAATEHLEQQLADAIADATLQPQAAFYQNAWQTFLQHCQTPGFRQIVLIDSPIVLGRERWHQCAVVGEVRKLLNPFLPEDEMEQELLMRLLLAAFAEAALMLAEAGDVEKLSHISQKVVNRLLAALLEK